MVVDVRGPGPIGRLALMRCGSSTHGLDTDQRYIGMIARPSGTGRYIGVVPASTVAIPGYYLLFAVTERKVPSQGVFIQVLGQG
jgi:galactose oxidase